MDQLLCMLAQLMVQNHASLMAQNQATLQAVADMNRAATAAQRPKAPTTEFPKWDGNRDTLPLWEMRLTSYKSDPFFNRVISWDSTQPGNEAESRRVLDDLLANVPAVHLDRFINDPSFSKDGIKALKALLDKN